MCKETIKELKLVQVNIIFLARISLLILKFLHWRKSVLLLRYCSTKLWVVLIDIHSISYCLVTVSVKYSHNRILKQIQLCEQATLYAGSNFEIKVDQIFLISLTSHRYKCQETFFVLLLFMYYCFICASYPEVQSFGQMPFVPMFRWSNFGFYCLTTANRHHQHHQPGASLAFSTPIRNLTQNIVN